MERFDEYFQTAIQMAMVYLPKLLLAVLFLLVGLWIINMLTKTFRSFMKGRGWEDSLQGFLNSMLSVLLKLMLGLSVISMLGIEATSFIAVLGAAGLAVGMALSGTLQNFAGGVMLLVFKPFQVGDYIDAQGYAGVVSEIQIFVTILKTPDNQKIILPNGPLSNGSVKNVTAESTRRVDLSFGIGYSDDIDKARSVISQVLSTNDKILKDPAPVIFVSELGDSSVNFVVRPWVKTEDYWGVYFFMQEQIKKEFDKAGISIPFPQTDVHIISQP